MRNACGRTALLCVVFAGCITLARGDTRWGAPWINPPLEKDTACTNKTGSGLIPNCDKQIGGQFAIEQTFN